MKKFLLGAVLMTAGISSINAESTSTIMSFEDNTMNVMSESQTYGGTATVTEMNGNSLSRKESATFTYDAETGDISGNFSIAFVHTLELTGNVNSIATGNIKMIITGKTYSFIATFSNVVCDGNNLSFDCTATTNEGKTSKFSFTGSLQ